MNEWRVGETRGCIGIKDASAELRAPPEMQLVIWDFLQQCCPFLSYLLSARNVTCQFHAGHLHHIRRAKVATRCGACAKNIYKA